jgi:hypothetical protein
MVQGFIYRQFISGATNSKLVGIKTIHFFNLPFFSFGVIVLFGGLYLPFHFRFFFPRLFPIFFLSPSSAFTLETSLRDSVFIRSLRELQAVELSLKQ